MGRGGYACVCTGCASAPANERRFRNAVPWRLSARVRCETDAMRRRTRRVTLEHGPHERSHTAVAMRGNGLHRVARCCNAFRCTVSQRGRPLLYRVRRAAVRVCVCVCTCVCVYVYVCVRVCGKKGTESMKDEQERNRRSSVQMNCKGNQQRDHVHGQDRVDRARVHV